MALIKGNRDQVQLLPASIGEYISDDDPVRAYDAFVEQLDIRGLGIYRDGHELGAPEYDPRAMLKLLVYGYSYGIRSSRKLERAAHHNLSFIWLMGGLRPDHKTIARFRRDNRDALRQVLRQCVRLCIKLDLIAGNILFVDGTKIRANASRDRSHDRVYYERRLQEIDKRIEILLRECEILDGNEEQSESLVAMTGELANAEDIKDKIRAALEELKSENGERPNLTDPDSAIMHSIQGTHASYNIQSVVDDQNGLIVQVDAVSESSDVNQFARQIQQANEVLEKPCRVACADAGYADTEELEKIDSQQIKVVVPSKRQALHQAESPFSKSVFIYDEKHDCYRCPEGQILKFSGVEKKNRRRQYIIADKTTCHNCRHYGICTKSKKGRKVVRLAREELKTKLERQYEEAANQAIYSRRKSKVEHPFGHIKSNLKVDAFLLRGRNGVQAETALLATCFNMVRLITIMGVAGLIRKITQ